MSGHLTPEQKSVLHAQLETEQRRLLLRAAAMKGDGLAPDPKDGQELAADEVGRRDMLALSDRDRARLHEIEAALARMTDGTYGPCEETGEPIPWARLQAEPTTQFTVEALEWLEEEGERERVRSGPSTDDDLPY